MQAAAEERSIKSLSEGLSNYLAKDQVNSVRRAYFYAEQAHDGQYRHSGDPYVTHPLAVASILGEMHMDHQSLMAAMLHDVIEDTGITKTAIKNQFGNTVADLVDGVSKLNKITFSSRAEAQAENFQKMAKRVIQSKNVKTSSKIHSILHLLNSTMFLNVLFVGVLSIPMLYIKNEWGHLGLYFDLTSFFIISTVIFFVCYWVLYRSMKGGGFVSFIEYIKLFFTFYTIAMGFSYHNSLAVIEGHRGKRSDFIRTPKFNIKTLKDTWKKNKYTSKKVSKNVFVEGLLALYFLFGMYSAFVVGKEGDFGLFPFHLMLFIGYGFVFINSFRTQA